MNSTIRRVPVTTLASGADAELTLHELSGVPGDGPTVGICAAIHGNEPTGTQIVLETARYFSSQRFRGRLLLLPVANPLAFQANLRHTPLDHQNMNRVFPGTPDGWFTEQLAHVVTNEFLTKVDVLIDLHSGGDQPTVDYVYIRNAEELSRAFGSRVLYRADVAKAGTMFAGTSISVTEARGVPSVTVELGGGVIDQQPYVERGLMGIRNILSVLGAIDEERPPLREQVVVDSIATIRPRTGGFLDSLTPPLGEVIEMGNLLGRVISPYTFGVLEEIPNPIEKGVMILSHLTRNLVEPGDYGYMVGKRES